VAFKLAEAVVKIGANTKPLQGALGRVKGMISGGIGLAFKAAKVVAVAGIAGIGAAIAGGIGLAKLGSDLEEMRSKFTAVFKEEEKVAREFASNLSQSVGRSQIAIEGMMSGLQDLFVPMGFQRDQARELSQSVTGLAVDLASFNNMSDDEAILALNAGLTGSHETLKRFGVFVNDNVLSLKLQEMGLAKNAQVATEQAKALARLQIIMESTTDAQGDAARTSGSLANTWKALKGQIFDMASQIGSALIPAAQSILGVFNGLTDWAKANQENIANVAARIGEAFAITFGKIMGGLNKLFGGWDDIWGSIGGIIDFIMDKVNRFAAIFQQNWDTMGDGIITVFSMVGSVIGGAFAGIIAGFTSFAEWVGQLQRTIYDFVGLSSGRFREMGTTISGVFASIKGWVVSALGTVKEWIEATIFTFLNLDLVTKRLGIKMAETFENIKIRVKTFAENVVILFKWIGDNWRDILFTASDSILTMLTNLGENIRTIFSAIWEAITTGSMEPLKELKDNMKGLMEGAANTISNMPAFKPFIATDMFKGQLNEVDKEWDKRAEKWRKAMEKNAPKTGEEMGEGIAEGVEKGLEKKDEIKLPKFDASKFDIKGTVEGKGDKAKKDSAGGFTGLEKMWSNLQAAILKPEKASLEKKGVALQEKQLAEQQKTNKRLDKIAKKEAVTTLG
jgi:hypothetical protein